VTPPRKTLIDVIRETPEPQRTETMRALLRESVLVTQPTPMMDAIVWVEADDRDPPPARVDGAEA
jgi:hypothetical protein